MSKSEMKDSFLMGGGSLGMRLSFGPCKFQSERRGGGGFMCLECIWHCDAVE